MRVRTVLIWEGVANAILALTKFVVGVGTGSAAILADALHSLTDLANNFIALFVVRIAEEPPDSEHPYGHQKFEQLAVFALAGLLTVVAFELIADAFSRFGRPPKQSIAGIVIMLGALTVNVLITTWENYWARRLKSDILLADARHTLSDVMVTAAVILGWQLSVFGWPWLDPLFGLLVAVMVLYLAFDLFRRAIPILVDSAAHDSRQLSRAVNQIPGVMTVPRVRSRQQGAGVVADVVVTVDGELSTRRAHDVADAVETLLSERFDIHDTTVHIEPYRVIETPGR